MRRRHSFALGVSLVAHAVIVVGSGVGLRCVPEFEMPEIELDFTEVELVDPNALQGAEPQPDPEPPPPTPEPPPATPPEPTPTDDASTEEKPEPTPEPEPEPEPEKFAAKGSRADELAPTTSTFYMLLVPKKIRSLPFAQQVLDIMAPLPDFEFLIDGGRFDALRDFDHIVIASPDIRDWTQTFLAVDYRVSREEVQRAIERAAASRNEVIEWVEGNGPLRGNPRPADPEKTDPDNRWFVFLDGKIAIYVRAEFLPNILAGPEDDERKTSGNFVSNLAKVRRFAARQPDAGMQVVLKDLRRNLKRSTLPFQIPDEFEISASAEEEPRVLVRGVFVNVVEAKAFMKWWEHDLRELIDGSLTVKFQIGWAYDLLQAEREGKQVRLSGQLTMEQAETIMKFAADGSRKVAGKSAEEVEEMRQRRVEAIEARKGGKLPPSALDPVKPDPAAGPIVQPTPLSLSPPAPATPPQTPDGTATSPPKPTKTPVNGAESGTANR